MHKKYPKRKSIKSKCLFSFILLVLICSGTQSQTKTNGKSEFPSPKGIENLLFYVQRTINTNTLIYTLNLNKNGDIDINEPIKINWINYAKDGSIEPLNYIQRNYAYGINVQLLDKEKKTFSFNFVSYKKKSIYLIKSQLDNKYHAYYTSKSGLIILDRIFIQMEKGNSFWTPTIKYIEVAGVNLKNEKVSEKIIP